MGFTDLELWAGPTVQWVHQERERLDALRLGAAGIPTRVEDNEAFAFGGELGLGWRIPVNDVWDLRVFFRTSLVAVDVTAAGETETSVIPTFGGGLGIGLRF